MAALCFPVKLDGLESLGIRSRACKSPQFSSHPKDVFTNQLVPLITVREFTD